MNKSFRWLWSLHFLNDGIRTTFVTLLPFIAKDLSLNLTSIGFLGSTQALLASILAVPAGFLASKMGGFGLITLLLLIYSLGSFALALSGSYFMVVAAFLFGALGFAMFHTISFSLVAKMSDKSNVGKNMGNFTSVGDIGRVCIPPLAVFAVPIIGWRLDFIILAIIGLSFFIFLKMVSRKDVIVTNQNQPENHKDFLKGIIELLKAKKLLLTISAAVLDSLAGSPVYIFLPFLLFSKGFQITEYGIVTFLFLVGSLAGKNILGRASDIFGNLKVFIVSEIIMAFLLLLLIFTSNFYFILIWSTLLGIFTRGTTPTIQAMFSQVSHKLHYDKIYGLSEMSIGMAGVIIIIIMGFLADNLGINFVYYSSALFALVAIVPALFLYFSDPGTIRSKGLSEP